MIPAARFAELDGNAHLPWYGDGQVVLAGFARFLGIAAPAPAADPEAARSDEAAALATLTPRELEMLALIADDLSEREIAERLVLSPHTVHRHVANIRSKLGLRTRAAAAALAARAKLR